MHAGRREMIEFASLSLDTAVPWHLGDPFAEARALEAGHALVDLSHYGVIRIAGADRLSWLHLLVTQNVEQLAPGQSCQALILSAQGHIEHDLKIVEDGTYLCFILEAGTAFGQNAYIP